jgi:hypothetical protein
MAVQQEAIPQSIERPVRRSSGCRAERLRCCATSGVFANVGAVQRSLSGA